MVDEGNHRKSRICTKVYRPFIQLSLDPPRHHGRPAGAGMPTLSHCQSKMPTEPHGWVSADGQKGRQHLLGIRDRICRLHEDSRKRAVSRGLALRFRSEPNMNQNP